MEVTSDMNIPCPEGSFNDSMLQPPFTITKMEGIHMRHLHDHQILLLFSIRTQVEQISVPFWCALGIPGALLSCWIWLQPRLRQTSGIYLAALALTDAVFFVTRIPFYLETNYSIGALSFPIVCEVYAVINIWIQYLAPILTLVFTAERYIFICHPYLAVKICTIKRAVKLIMIVVSVGLLLSLPHAYLFRYHPVKKECSEIEEFNDPSSWVNRFYVNWNYVSEVLLFVLLPSVVLGLNILVIFEMRKLIRRVQTRGKPSHEISTSTVASTITLLCISFYYVATTFPVTFCQIVVFTMPAGDVCLTVAEALENPQWKRFFTFQNVRALVDCFGYSHYAGKLFIYLITSARFRREFVERLFCRQSNVPFNNIRHSPSLLVNNPGCNVPLRLSRVSSNREMNLLTINGPHQMATTTLKKSTST